MKRIILLFFIVVLLTISCSRKSDQKNLNSKNESVQKKKIGLALGYGGIGDQSFNDMQYNGLINASRKFDIEISYKVPEHDDEDTMIKILDELVNEKCDMIITSGYLMVNPVDIVSKRNPNIIFAILDQYAKPSNNVASVVFMQHEGSFVVGALSGLVTKTGKIGFIGGVDIPVIKSFLVGFEEGIKYTNKNAKLVTQYCSLLPDFSGFSDPDKGYKIAKKCIRRIVTLYIRLQVEQEMV
ncbi:MAG TPA: BMP family ABC transporter substrate-binding protein [Spirochaetota bacterium]|nr:BMP family ABC transporter substrate-binding protein [Spirochaetota bacterium]